MRVLTVIGNRPQFIKAAAVSPLLRARHEELLVHTGQHHDDRLSRVFFEELGVPAPDVQLGVSGGSNSSQTARMLAALADVVAGSGADCVLVYGDTNSTLAGALAAVQADLPVAHVEAGMRSFDRGMPEEINRVMTDHVSALLLCSSGVGVANLAAEGVSGAGRPPRLVAEVGDVMVDVALKVQASVRDRDDLLAPHQVARGQYVMVTSHRAGNVDLPERLSALVSLLVDVAGSEFGPIVFPVHPRTRARLAEFGLFERLASTDGIRLCEPLGYVETAALLCGARALLTDSGGLQKEAYLAGIPCVTLRPSTEWVETVDAGWNTLVDLSSEAALAALRSPAPDNRPGLYGDGTAGSAVVAELERIFGV